MTARQLAALLGREGYLSAGEFEVRVQVLDARVVFDRTDYLVRGIEGARGEAWVAAYRVTLDE